jgi:enoyl-CoA hydratase
MEYNILSLQLEEPLGLITINRPDAMNALNTAFFLEMDSMLTDLENDGRVKVIVLTGAGKAFVAGADIAEMVDMGAAEAEVFSQLGQRIFRRMETYKKPIIGAVNGFALGGGMELAMGCDVLIASEKARFGQPEVNLGLIPGYAATQRLPRIVGRTNALRLLLSAEMIGAQEALTMGLVQKVVSPEALIEEAKKFALLIASKGPIAVQTVKKAVVNGLDMDIDAGSMMESKLFGTLFGNEGAEGMKAFLEKRNPNW